MKYFNVSFQYSESVYCANIAFAETVEDVETHYSKYEWFKISEATDGEVDAARRKGMPIIKCEHIEAKPAAEPETIEEAPQTDETAQDETNVESMVSVDVIAENVDLGDYADRLNDYRDSSTYICDAISEIADNATSIYYSDIIKFISENVEAVNDAICEFGWDGCGSDLYKAGQMAEFMQIDRDIHEHLADALRVCARDFLRYDLGCETIPEELADMVGEWCESADHNDRLNNIPDMIREWLEDHNETAN